MKVFITGGSGFLGSRLTPSLIAVGHEVTALALTCKDAEVLRGYGARPIVGDLSSVSKLELAMDGCDTVIHVAAFMDVWGDPKKFETINIIGTENIISAAKNANIGRFVYVSAASVVLGAGDVEGDESLPRMTPSYCNYTRTKSIAEGKVLAANADGFVTIAIRPPFIWGAGDNTTIPTFKNLIDDGRFTWFSGGNNLFSTCHVANVAEGVLMALEHGRGGNAYFITDGEPITYKMHISEILACQGVVAPDKSVPRWAAQVVAYILEKIWKILGKKEMPPITRSLILLMAYQLVVDDAKARSELGYVGRMTRAAGLAELS